MPRKNRSRIYWRTQGGALRAYADFRDLGGGREALIAEGEGRATTDPVVAETLVAARLKELREEKRDQVLLGVKRRATLKEYAAEHLVKKARSGNVTDKHLEDLEHELREAVRFFGERRELSSIGVEHVQDYAHHLASLPNRRGGTLSLGSQRHYLNALSNLFRRATGEGVVRRANPVAALMDKPAAERVEARWLEVWEAALLLEAARTYPYNLPDDAAAAARLRDAIRTAIGTGPDAADVFASRMREAGTQATPERVRAYLAGERLPTRAYLLKAAEVLGIPRENLWRPRGAVATKRPPAYLFPLVATYLLTGGRKAEVGGLQLGDVNLRRKTITFRRNTLRRLKTRTSYRTIPYWPQLQEILEPHLERRRRAGAREHDLVFVSGETGAMVTEFRRSLDAVAARAGWAAGEIRSRMFRHTYCAARLQTLEGGEAVSEYTVGRELGHGGFALVRQVYGHLGEIPHRSEVVEYRVEQQRDVIPPERLRLLMRAV